MSVKFYGVFCSLPHFTKLKLGQFDFLWPSLGLLPKLRHATVSNPSPPVIYSFSSQTLCNLVTTKKCGLPLSQLAVVKYDSRGGHSVN